MSRVVIVVVLIACSACSKGTQKEATSAAKTAGRAVETAAAKVANKAEGLATKDVTLQQIAYHPQRLEIKLGEQVKWSNLDDFAHTVTADNDAFNSGDLNGGKDYTFHFTQRGEYPYHCEIHGKARMSGTIVVQ